MQNCLQFGVKRDNKICINIDMLLHGESGKLHLFFHVMNLVGFGVSLSFLISLQLCWLLIFATTCFLSSWSIFWNWHNLVLLRVTLADQTTYDAKVVGFDQDKDVAVLKIDAPKDKMRPIPIGVSADLLVGQKVFAIGNPVCEKYKPAREFYSHNCHFHLDCCPFSKPALSQSTISLWSLLSRK